MKKIRNPLVQQPVGSMPLRIGGNKVIGGDMIRTYSLQVMGLMSKF